MTLLRLLLISLFFLTSVYSYAQKIDSIATDIQNIPGRYYSKVDQKLTSINDRLTKKSLKYLAKFQKHEKRL
ncbi:MAG: hypothetical protein ABIN93_01105, partial [Ginsengibacter sp.]